MKTLNGWTTSPPLATITVAKHSTRVRAGATATLLQWVAREIHASGTESVATLYGYRTVAENTRAGGITGSNHVSGTAIDYNGGRHPYERKVGSWHSGWTASQERAVVAILAATKGSVRWGLYFNRGYRDGMHFEVVGTEAAAKKAAKRITSGSVRVTAGPLLGRAAPSTKAKILYRRPKGFVIGYVDVVFREGRLWLLTKYGTYYAAEFTSWAK